MRCYIRAVRNALTPIPCYGNVLSGNPAHKSQKPELI